MLKPGTILVLLTACSPEHSTSAIANTAPTGGAHYEILAAPMLGANNVTSNVVRVIGTNADGTPATDAVVLGTNRPGAGRYTSSRLTLGEIGAQTSFIACDHTTTGCLGPVSLEVALASAPNVIVARVDVSIVDPLLVDPARQCRGGGNALYLNGNDQIYTGEETIDATATWVAGGFANLATITAATATESWKLQFNTARIQNVDMFPGPYLGATLAMNTLVYDQPIGDPAMNISGANTCGSITGKFVVLDYFATNTTLTATIVFEQHCEGSATTALRGCVHVQP